jgi:DNA processing protein
LIKQGAKLVARWEDVWEDSPSRVRREWEAKAQVESGHESKRDAHASVLPDPVTRPQESIVLEVLCADVSLQIDEILGSLESQLTSAEVFTAFFELEIAGRIHQLPGKNYDRAL